MAKVLKFYLDILIKKWSIIILFVLTVFIAFTSVIYLIPKLKSDHDDNYFGVITLMPLLVVSIVFATMVSIFLYKESKKFKLDFLLIIKGNQRFILIISKLLISLAIVLTTSICVGFSASIARQFNLKLFLSFFVGEFALLIFIIGFTQVLAMFLNTIFVLGVPLSIFIATFPLSIINETRIGNPLEQKMLFANSFDDSENIYLEKNVEHHQWLDMNAPLIESKNSNPKAYSSFAFPPIHFSVLYSIFNNVDYFKAPYTKVVHDISNLDKIKDNHLSFRFSSQGERYFVVLDPKVHDHEFMQNLEFLLKNAKRIILKNPVILDAIISNLRRSNAKFLDDNFAISLTEPFAQPSELWNVGEDTSKWKMISDEMLESGSTRNAFLTSLFSIIQQEAIENKPKVEIPEFEVIRDFETLKEIAVSESYLDSRIARNVPIINAWGVFGVYFGLGFIFFGIWALRFRRVDLSK